MVQCLLKLLQRATVTIGVICGLAATNASAQAPSACSEELIEQSRRANLTPHYAARLGNYCDGAAAAEHAGRLEIRSMMRGAVAFASERLEIASKRDVPYFVRGWDLRPFGAYRLDGELSEGVLVVDLAPAIQPIGLQPNDLGLYAWRDDGLYRVYAPVVAGGSGSVVVKLRSAARLRAVRFAVLCPGTSNDCGIEVPNRIDSTGGGAYVSLVLPEVPAGRYRLTVTAAGTASGDFPVGTFDLDL